MTKTNIEWTERVWNPFAGCSVLSPGCTNCYAMKMARRIEACNAGLRQGHGGSPHYAGTTKIVNGNAVWTGKIGIASDDVLTAPLRRKKPTTYFVNSMSDLFHENVPDDAIDKVFAVMALTPQHTFHVLTKRSARMRAYLEQLSRNADRDSANELPAGWQVRLAEVVPAGKWPLSRADAARCLGVAMKMDGDQPTPRWPLPNVWLGVSTERQKEADERIPDLLATPAAVRFISAEPLLGPIDLRHIAPTDTGYINALNSSTGPNLNWVIVGGENGPRPMNPDDARSTRDQCAAAGVPYFFKQWGTNIPDAEREGRYRRVPKSAAGRLLDGIEHNDLPSK